MEVDETRPAFATKVFGQYLKTDDDQAVTDVVSARVIDDTSAGLEGDDDDDDDYILPLSSSEQPGWRQDFAAHATGTKLAMV